MKKSFDQTPDFRRAFGNPPPAFTDGVERTLRRLQENKEEIKMKRKIPAALAVALIVLALTGAVYAAAASHTVDLLKWFYGDNLPLDQVDVAPCGQSYGLGDVVYTLDDVVYNRREGALYGSGVITVKEGAKAVLLAEDYAVDDPAGYLLHYGEEEIPQGAPSYRTLAQEQGAKMLLVKLVPEGYMREGTLFTGDIGYNVLPGKDNAFSFWFEIYADPEDPQAVDIPLSEEFKAELIASGEDPAAYAQKGVPLSEEYTLKLHLSNWEIAPDGQWLREAPQNTWLQEEWIVTVRPSED